MATSSSSPLVLFIDTDHDTHFSLTIDGDQSIAQLKRRIISDHANCFPEFGEISVAAVKAKRGEFFYHLSDFMILSCFFQDAEGYERFQVDILSVSSTIKSSEHIKTSSDAPMYERQFENLDHLNCKSDGGTSAKMNEKVQFDPSMKESWDLRFRSVRKKEILSDGKNSLLYDSLQKISGAPSGNPLKQNYLKVSINDCSNKCSNSYKSGTLQLDDSMKDSSNLKHTRKRRKKVSKNKKNLVVNINYSDFEHGRKKKKKVSSNQENPLVNNSLQKINDTTSQNQAKMAIDAHIEKKSLETNEAVNHNFVHAAPVQLDTNTSTKDYSDLKLKSERKRKVSRNHDLSYNPLVEDSLYKLNRILRADSQTKEDTLTQKKKQRYVVKKIPYTRFGSVSNKSNEDELAPTIMLNEKKDGIGSNRHCSEKAISGSHTKVEHDESLMDKMDDALHKNQTKMDIEARMEKKLPETDQDMNCISIHEAPVQLDTNTSIKDPSDLKPKRKKKKVSRNEELSHYPLVEDSLHMVNDTRADNQPNMSIVKEPISKEKSQPSTTEHAESLLQTTIDDKLNRKEKVSEVRSPSKLLNNNTSINLDSNMHGTVVSSTGLISCDNTATDKISKHEHIKNWSIENDPIIKIWNDSALKFSNKGSTNRNIVRSDNNIEEIVQTEKKKQRHEAKKIPSSRSGNVLKKSNEDELAPTFMLNEKNDGRGSNMHALEKANYGCRTKVDSNVNLDNTKMSPDCRRKLEYGSNATQNATSIGERVSIRKGGVRATQTDLRDVSSTMIYIVD